MYAIPWYVVLFVSIPESYLIIILGFALYNLEIDSKLAFAVAVITSVVAYFVRQLHLTFGIHTIIGMVVIIILIKLLTSYNFYSLATVVLTGFVVMALLQCIIVPFTLMLTSVNPLDFSGFPWLNIVFFIPEALMMLFMYFMINKHHLYIIDLRAGEKDSQDN